jgi:aminoglycoside phosphotransferase (APT) family kinase protein
VSGTRDDEDPLATVREALGLSDEAVVEPAGGASGSAWRVRTATEVLMLRRASSDRAADAWLSAVRAARAADLPAPELLRRATTAAGEMVLLSWLPGISLMDAVLAAPADAPRWGRQMGELQRRLHEIAAPPELPSVTTDRGHPFVAGAGMDRIPEGDRLLHLDWHPLNLVTDGATGEISGIVDWDNARRGHPWLDVARTHAMLTVEPTLGSLPTAIRAQITAIHRGWTDGYGPEALNIPAACLAWAGRVMVADLEPRYTDAPETLDPLRRWTDDQTGRSVRPPHAHPGRTPSS